MLAISYCYCRTEEKKAIFNNLASAISMESNELYLTAKLSFVLAVAFQATEYQVVLSSGDGRGSG